MQKTHIFHNPKKAQRLLDNLTREGKLAYLEPEKVYTKDKKDFVFIYKVYEI